MKPGKTAARKPKRLTKWGFGAYSLLVLALVLFVVAEDFAQKGASGLAMLAMLAGFAMIIGHASIRHHCRRNGFMFIENAPWKDQ